MKEGDTAYRLYGRRLIREESDLRGADEQNEDVSGSSDQLLERVDLEAHICVVRAIA